MIKQHRILILANTIGGGDCYPLVATALALVARGHQVVLIGDDRLVADTKGTSIICEAVPLDQDLRFHLQRWWRETKRPPESDPTSVPFRDWVQAVLPFVRSRIDVLMPHVILCSDTTLLLACELHRCIGISVCLINSTFYYGPGARRRIDEDFAGRSAQYARGLARLSKNADLVLHATDPIFDPPPETSARNNYWIGPLFWEPRGILPSCLDTEGNSWVLVTLSSARQEGEVALARVALNALSGRFPLRVLLTLADSGGSEDIRPVDQSQHIERYVPHSEILGRSVLCINHGGHGIVLKSLYFGVPMVLVPWERDQPGVAARAHDLGVARVVRREELNEFHLASAINDVLESSTYSDRVRDHATRMQCFDSRAAACNYIEKAASMTA